MTSGKDMALSGYRALDLSEEGALICGRMLADMGADVIKIEKPGGSTSRAIGPFFWGGPHPERSIFWWYYNANKRGITVDIEMPDGQELVKKLVGTADFVLESFEPGFLDRLGLSYSNLRQINPGIIMVSIAPFGQSGPKANYRMSELTSWASCGALYVTGDVDRPPVWMGSVPHAALGAAIEAVVGALAAAWYRETSGEGQHVDVSIQACGIDVLQVFPEAFDITGYVEKRIGNRWMVGGGKVSRRTVFPCKDGYVAFTVMGGGVRESHSTEVIVNWAAEEEMAPDWLKNFDWINGYGTSVLTQELVDKVEPYFVEFFMTKPKRELFERSVEEGAILAPVNTIQDLWIDPQLKARDYWAKVTHPQLEGKVLDYPGAFIKMSETPITISRCAPSIGEHNEEIYCGEVGLTREELVTLAEARVI